MNEDNKVPEILYHYTTMEGLLGIVEKKTLWATNIHYLNDAAEYLYAAELIVNRFEKYLTTLPPKPAVPAQNLDAFIRDKTADPKKQLQTEILRAICTTLGRIFKEVIYYAYICSFTENGDQLSQWRGYCPQGNCFSIGFKIEDLLSIMERNSFKLIKCIYEPYAHETIIEEIISRRIEALKKEIEATSMEAGDEVAYETVKELSELIPQIKHETFKEEHEWRFVRGMPQKARLQNVKFRKGKSMIVPYIEVPLEDVPISEVYIGPTPHKKISRDSVKLLLEANGFGNFEIKLSDSPYRTW